LRARGFTVDTAPYPPPAWVERAKLVGSFGFIASGALVGLNALGLVPEPLSGLVNSLSLSPLAWLLLLQLASMFSATGAFEVSALPPIGAAGKGAKKRILFSKLATGRYANLEAVAQAAVAPIEE
jgi:hypothetical protein